MSIDIQKINIKEIGEGEYRSAYFLMSEQRKKKCSAYKNTDDKKLCIAADLLLRKMLSEKFSISKADIVIKTAENGKPYTEIPGAFFSLSHSGCYAAAAVGESELGVDIEKIRPVKAGVARYFCSTADLQYIFGDKTDFAPAELLTQPEQLRRFFEVWTFKEAYFKRQGLGIWKYAAEIDFQPHKKLLEYPEHYVLCAVCE